MMDWKRLHQKGSEQCWREIRREICHWHKTCKKEKLRIVLNCDESGVQWRIPAQVSILQSPLLTNNLTGHSYWDSDKNPSLWHVTLRACSTKSTSIPSAVICFVSSGGRRSWILDPGSWILPYYSSPVRRHVWTESRGRGVAWNDDRPALRFAVDSGIRVPLQGRRRVAEWWRERDHLEKRRPRFQEIRRLTLATSLLDQRKKRESSVFLIGTKHASGSALLEVHSETKEMSEEGTTQSGQSFSWRFGDRKVDHPRSAGQSLSPDKFELPAKEVGEV